METFDLAVGLRPVGPGPFRCDAKVCAGIAPGEGSVAAAVVGQDAFNAHAALGEPGDGVVQDVDGGVGLLISADLCVGDSGVVIDDGVHERGADDGPVVPAARTGASGGCLPVVSSLDSADEAMPATVGDAAEFGDVDVDQRARVVVLVAADRFTGDSIDMGEPVDPAAPQNGVHRRGCDACLAGDLRGPKPMTPPQPHDLLNHGRRRLGRAGPRPRAAIGHTRDTLGVVAIGPLGGRPCRDHEHLRRRGPSPALIDNQTREPQPRTRSQNSISVGHEGLRLGEVRS